MIVTTTNPYCVLFKQAEPWCRLTSINNAGLGVLHAINIMPCRCRHTGETLEEVQGYPLSGQQGTGWTVHLSDHVPRCKVRSIHCSTFNTYGAIYRVKDCSSDFKPRQYERF